MSNRQFPEIFKTPEMREKERRDREVLLLHFPKAEPQSGELARLRKEVETLRAELAEWQGTARRVERHANEQLRRADTAEAKLTQVVEKMSAIREVSAEMLCAAQDAVPERPTYDAERIYGAMIDAALRKTP